MKFQKNCSITIVRPNTHQDVINCDKKGVYYNPLVKETYILASDLYKQNKFECFDVVDKTEKTKGIRTVYLMDIGEIPEEDRKHMECGGITKAFLSENESDINAYIENLMSDENILYTYSMALEMWGVNTQNEKAIKDFISSNELLKGKK